MPRRLYFKNLDALRFLAFLGVFTSHTLPVSNSAVHTTEFSELLIYAFSFSYLGVPFFFTLSSFLITFRLIEEHKVSKDVQLLEFYLKRGLRIWPIYFLLIFICYIIIPFIFSIFHLEKPTLPDIFPFIFFWSNFYMIDHGVNFISALTILWSLSIEEQFYIFWGLLLKYFKQYLMLVMCILLVGAIIFCYYYIYIWNKKPMNLKIHSFYALPNFCFGTLLAMVCQSKKGVFNFLKNLPNIFYAIIYFLLIAFYVLQNLGITHFDIIFTVIYNSACYALILFDQTFNKKRLFNAGSLKIINYLGRISYGLYIYHLLVVSLMIKAFQFFAPQPQFYTNFLQAVLTLLITILVSHISYKYFENYFLTLKDRL